MKYLINKYKKVLMIYSFIYIALIGICVIRTDNSITAVGDVTSVNETMSVISSNTSSGSFNSIYVISIDRPSIFQSFVASMSSDLEIDKLGDAYSHFSNDELYKMGVIQKNQSIEASVITSYEKAGKDVDYEFEGLIVSYYRKEVTDFLLGDIIYKINDKTNQNDLIDAFNKKQENDTFYILRDNKEVEVKIGANDLGNIGAYLKYDVNYDILNPILNILPSSSVGPSAGLMQSLTLYNGLTTTDYTYGLKIAGTGTINAFGTVGAIGGEKYKVKAAISANCDIMFIPQDNYESAYEEYKKHKTDMKLVSVDTFDDALNYLKEQANESK